MKNILSFLGIILISILLGFTLISVHSFSIAKNLDLKVDKELQTQEKLLEIFENSGASPYELKIEAWKKINNIHPSKKAIEEILQLAVKEFAGEILTKDWTEEKNFQSLRIVAGIEGGFLTAVAQKVDEKFYLITNVEGTSFTNLSLWQKNLKNIFNYYNVKPEISINLTGSLPKKLSKEEQYKLVKKLFQESKATILEGIVTDHVVSQSGYSPHIKNELVIGNKKLNLNIATRPHSEDECTYLFIGSPVLTCEY